MTKVYFTKDISSKGLIRVFEALNVELQGRVAVKISSGEMGGHNYLQPKLIEPLVTKLKGTIVECNTAYKGKRETASDHWEVIKSHGFLDIAPCDIMDEDGEMEIPIDGGKHLNGKNIVGSHLANYDSMLMLSHFKGHAMGGFGGALKNMSIGVASRNGKAWIHSAGKTNSPQEMWSLKTEQDDFLESMAEACKGVIDYMGENNIVYINVLNNISIDCDCDSNPHNPEIEDIGIYASTDPVAIDKCSYVTIMNLKEEGANSLKVRMTNLHAIHTAEEAEKLGLGSLEYEIINIDEA